MKRFFFLFSLAVWLLARSLPAQVLYVAAAGDLRDEAYAEEFRSAVTVFTSLFVENLPSENLSVYNAPGSVWTGGDILTSDHPFETLKTAIADCPAQGEDGILVFWIGRGGMVKDEFFFFDRGTKPFQEESPEIKAGEGDSGGESPDETAEEVPEPDGEAETGADASETDTDPPRPEADNSNQEDANEKEGPAERRIPRSELVLALKEKKVRFTGLITDSSRQFKRGNPEKNTRYTPNAEEITSLMSSLFFETRGFLDFNSCRRNQTSLLVGYYGSLLVAAMGEFLETGGDQYARWTETVDAVNARMRDRARPHKQKIDLFSVPKEPRRDPPPPPPPGFPPEERPHRSAQLWRDDWNEIARDIQARLERGREERYPADYEDAPSRFRSSFWSPPRYYPERGDLLIGINGRRIMNYEQYLDAIQQSPEMIYLTVIDHRTGIVYEMRTVMGPPGPPVRLGLAVVEDPWGGVRVTNTILGSPAAHCQYLIGYRHWRYAPFGMGD